jgi:hypothetical protein
LTYASDGDFDIGGAGLSFATMLETSARIAVVAPRDVRRKDRRVCINEQKDEVKSKKYEGTFREVRTQE